MKKVIAAFDFDGTLTYVDATYLFVYHCFGFKKGWRLIPSIAKYLMGKMGRQEIKEKILQCYFKGLSLKEYQEKAREFFEGYRWNYRKEVLSELDRYKKEGATIVIVTANFEPFVEMAKIPYDCVIGTKMELPEAKIVGKNCWGPEKLRRLLEKFPDRDQYELIAYGDSAGDKELLGNADVATWV